MMETRKGTSLAACARENRGDSVSPPMIPMKTWSPTAQVASRAQLAKPYFDLLACVFDFEVLG